MKRDSKPWARSLAGALALLLAFAFAVPPAAASEVVVKAPAQTPNPPQAEQPTLTEAVAAKVEAMDTAQAVEMAPVQDAVAMPESSGSFLKSPKGVAAVALVAVGIAFSFYKRSNDRITSPVR